MTTYRFDEIAINSTQKKKPTEEDKVCYIGLEHIDSGCFDVVRWGSDVAPTGDKLLMQKGDVLFGKRRAYQRKVAIAPFDGIFSAHGMVLRPNLKVIDANYFPFFISSDKFMETAVRISVGGLSPTINWKDLARQEFELPSLDEQKVLADKLWAAYRLKEAYKKLLVATDEMVKSQFIEMFGSKCRTDAIGNLLKITSGGTPSSKKQEYYEGGTIPWLTSGEVSQGIISSTKSFITEAGLNNSSAKWVSKGSVVVAMYGATAGKTGILDIDTTTNQAVCSLLPSDNFTSIYLYYAVKSNEKWMMDQATGGAQPNISQTVIKKMVIPVPSIEQQHQFASIAQQADKSKFGGFKSQFIEMFGGGANRIKLSSLCSTFVDGDWIESKDQSELGIRLIQTGNVGNGFFKDKKDKSRYISEETFDNLHCTEIYPGDILVSRLPDPIGRACIIPQGLGRTITAVDCTIIRLKDIILPDYFIAYTMTPSYAAQINEVTTGTTRRRISRANLGNILIPCSSIAKQQQFVAIAKQADKSKYVLLKLICTINNPDKFIN